MEELTVNALVAGTSDYKESDKLLKLITAERGVINAVIKGVKKNKAKLKFAAIPFAFCQYDLLKRNEFYTVKTATLTESLFGVAEDPDKYVAGSIMLETAAVAVGETAAPSVFLYLLGCIKKLLYSDTDAFSVALNFICRLLINGGYYAPSLSSADYACDIEKQASLPRDFSLPRLSAFSRIFEEKLCCKLKSPSFIKVLL